jgi:hypothetical protein
MLTEYKQTMEKAKYKQHYLNTIKKTINKPSTLLYLKNKFKSTKVPLPRLQFFEKLLWYQLLWTEKNTMLDMNQSEQSFQTVFFNTSDSLLVDLQVLGNARQSYFSKS